MVYLLIKVLGPIVLIINKAAPSGVVASYKQASSPTTLPTCSLHTAIVQKFNWLTHHEKGSRRENVHTNFHKKFSAETIIFESF